MKLKFDKEKNIQSSIIDEEGDEIICKFNYDRCIELETKDYTYITLNITNLLDMIEMIRESERMYENEYKKPKYNL